jgi:hypothetical protein
MLTEEAYYERLWGKYPALQNRFKQKDLPLDYYEYATVSDSIFDRTERLLKVTLLVRDNMEGLQGIPDSERSAIVHDLERLSSDLESLQQSLSGHIQVIRHKSLELQDEQ